MISLILAFLCSVLMIISILFFPKIKIGKKTFDTYWLITLSFAIILIISKQVNIDTVKNLLWNSSSMNPIKIIILFLSMTSISIYLDQLGFFYFLATKATHLFHKNQELLFLSLFLLISILTIFTSNDIIILTFTPFICCFCKHVKINPIPYLIAEFFAANTLSMALLIGNPTNIYISLVLDISFLDYFKHMFLIGLLTASLLYLLLIIIFHHQLKQPLQADETISPVKSKFLVNVGLIHLFGNSFLLALSNYLSFEMYLISLCFSLSLMLISFIYSQVTKAHQDLIFKTVQKLPFAFIPFLLSMVIIIGSIPPVMLEELAGELNKYDSSFLYGISSFILGNLVNNIPMSIFVSEILKINQTILSDKTIYLVIASSNLCALFSPLGSLAGMMFLSLLKQYQIDFTFKKFLKYSFVSLILFCFVALMLSVI